MNFDQICDYVTLAEVADRWKLRRDSWMLHRAILRGVLKPCIFSNGADLPRVEVDERGAVSRLLHEDEPVVEHVRAWLYPWHGFKQQSAPFDALFPIVSDMCDVTQGARLYALRPPISLTDLLAEGVVMMPDLHIAEAELKRGESHEMGAKEVGTVLRILSATLADCFAYDPTKRSDFAGHISKAGAKFGIQVSDGSVLKWARRAFAEYPPDYNRGKTMTLETGRALSMPAASD